MRVMLQVINGPETGRKLSFKAGQLAKVGRTEWSDIALSLDGQISGTHFSIEIKDGNCLISDLKSSNGTFVNEKRITATQLSDGDIVLVGETRLQVAISPLTRTGIAYRQSKQQPTNDDHVSENLPDSVDRPATDQDTGAEPDEPVRTPIEPQPDPQPVADQAPVVIKKTMAGGGSSFSPRQDLPDDYAAALGDDDAGVRQAALESAVWNREPWLLKYCRRMAAAPTPGCLPELLVLAILGDASDIERILVIGRNQPLGTRRFAIMGAYGHPSVVPDLLIAMVHDDAAIADAAHKAFTKITGQQFESETIALIAESDDEFDQEFADEVTLPDSTSARQFWDSETGRFSTGLRWCCGHDLSDVRSIDKETVSQLDMGSIRETLARLRYFGVGKTSRADLDRFPFRVRM